MNNKPIENSFAAIKNLMLICNYQLNFRLKQFYNLLNIFCENIDETFIGLNKKNIVKTFLQQVRNSYFLKAITNIR